MTRPPEPSIFQHVESKGSVIFDKKIWRISDVEALTGYSKGTLYNLTSKGLIPHRKKRGRLFFIPDEILNWIEEGNV